HLGVALVFELVVLEVVVALRASGRVVVFVVGLGAGIHFVLFDIVFLVLEVVAILFCPARQWRVLLLVVLAVAGRESSADSVGCRPGPRRRSQRFPRGRARRTASLLSLLLFLRAHSIDLLPSDTPTDKARTDEDVAFVAQRPQRPTCVPACPPPAPTKRPAGVTAAVWLGCRAPTSSGAHLAEATAGGYRERTSLPADARASHPRPDLHQEP